MDGRYKKANNRGNSRKRRQGKSKMNRMHMTHPNKKERKELLKCKRRMM